MSSELIIFKKDTDAVGTNRGFVYQYLKTLIQWLHNYKSGIDSSIYCEVEDDIKQINRESQAIQWTQVKCYSSVFNLNHRDITKSLHNFFVLFVSSNQYDGNFCFETNSKISRNDKLLKEWISSQPIKNSNMKLISSLVVEVQKILLDTTLETKNLLLKDIATKISTIEKSKSKSVATKKKNLQLIDNLKKEHQLRENLALEMHDNIMDIEMISKFILNIKWSFDSITPEVSIERLKDEAIKLIEEIDTKVPAELYFNRLLSEIFLKSTESEIEDRCLDNALLKEIFTETEVQIKENIEQVFIDRFDAIESILQSGFGEVNTTLTTISKKIDTISATAIFQTEVSMIDLPVVESEDLEQIMLSDSEKQSKLAKKIEMINIKDPELQDSLISVATELRCRYLLFLQKLKLENLNSHYTALKQLEAKVKMLCTNTVIDNDAEENEGFDARTFWRSFQEELKLLLKDLKTRKNIDFDEEIVFAQMYQMAAECHLRWHRLEGDKDERRK